MTVLVTSILVLAILGFIVWLITTYIPMPEPFKVVIVVASVIVALLWFINSAHIKF